MKAMALPDEARERLASAWLARVLETYAPQTTVFYGRGNDPFANPVGHTLTTQLRVIADGLCAGEISLETPLAPAILEAVEAVVRIRAVQGLPPGRAVDFVYALRPILHELAGEGSLSQAPDLAALGALDATVDALALAAFEAYVRCRDRIHELRVDEVKRSVATLIRRWNTFYQTAPGEEPPPEVRTLLSPDGTP
jgi:hypothetical protein